MDESTTEASTQEQATYESQPEEQHAEAEYTPTSEPTDTNDEAEATSEPEQSDNSQESTDPAAFWAKKGIDITTPEGLAKATQSYSEAEKRMHQTAQKSSELEKQLSSAPAEQVSNDPVAQQAYDEAKSVRLELQVERWKSSNNVTPEQDAAIGQYLQTNTDKAYMLKNGYLTLDDVAAMSGAMKQNTEAIKSQGSRETLEKLANKQTASAVTGNASTSAPSAALTKANADSWWAGLGSEGRQNPENRAKLDAVLNS